jgi:hypothetical protein
MHPRIPRLRRLSLLASLALVVGGCVSLSGPEPPDDAIRVLFIGNSLTYANNLPATVAQLAASAGLPPCHCVAVAYPDFALEDHAVVGDALTEFNRGDYQVVVMQQGPSAHPESRVSLVAAAKFFAERFKPEGARGIMYGVWPSASRSFDFDGVRDSYRAAAASIDGVLAPAGVAWQNAWAVDPTLPLYAADGFHPSAMGTYLAALVVFQRVYDRSPVNVQQPAIVNGSAQPWPLAIVQLLQQAAAAANAAEDGD